MEIIAPAPTSLRLVKLAANYAYLKWDDVGSNFYYEIQLRIRSGEWNSVEVVRTNEYFDSNNIIPNTEYQYRIRTTYGTFEPSEWVNSEWFTSFELDLYQYSVMSNFVLNNHFIQNKFEKNDTDYIDFNRDLIQASLMNESFVYNRNIKNASNVQNFIVSDDEYHEIQGNMKLVCDDVEKTFLSVNDSVLYIFERYQNMARVSNDGGQTWYYVQALNDRIGYPTNRTVMYQNKNTSFLLGYDYVFVGVSSDDMRFSSVEDFWSNNEYTFVENTKSFSVPFDTLKFAPFVKYPQSIRRRIESQCASDRWIYAVANDELRRIQTVNTPIGVDEDDPTQFTKQWDSEKYSITGNPNCVIRKMDVLNDKCYILVVGEVDEGSDKRNDKNIKSCEHVGVYRVDEKYEIDYFTLGNLDYEFGGAKFVKGLDIDRQVATFAPDGSHLGKVNSSWIDRVFVTDSGITMKVVEILNSDSFRFEADLSTTTKKNNFIAAYSNPNKFRLMNDDANIPVGLDIVKIFGLTEQERSMIDYTSSMSTDGKKIMFNSTKFKYDDLLNEDGNLTGYADYVTSKKRHLLQFETYDGETFKTSPQTYYGESYFNWSRIHGERSWISNDNRCVVVKPKRVFTIDTKVGLNDRVVSETNDNGEIVIKMENFEFKNFSKYANGILLHRAFGDNFSTGGEIIGFIEFPYRVRDNVNFVWRPTNVMLTANLLGQTRPAPRRDVEERGLIDPDLQPKIVDIIPETYLDENFEAFGKYYLKFLSSGRDTHYNRLINLIRNKYPREKDNFEYLWSEIRKRNLYLDEKKRDDVVRFFEANANNFYSSKGTEASYKFLFKLLYNVEVDIETESSVGVDYDIVLKSFNISDDIVGRTISTKTGTANVTYYEREFVNGEPQWKVTVHNLMGKFEAGQIVTSDSVTFDGTISRGVRGKELAYSDIDYLDRRKSYYVMKIKSGLNVSQYRDDVIRFVHPVGFGFVGVTVLTVFINSGISLNHVSTQTLFNKTFRFDAGIPNGWPMTLNVIDPNSPSDSPIPLRDSVTGELLEQDNPSHPPINGKPAPFSIEEWNNSGLNRAYLELEGPDSDELRRHLSPLFSDFSCRWNDFKRVTEHFLSNNN